ncbi:GNAT family N-acetyltransferase [Streptomyces lasiicapitis]|nr:GNAT family N-acetyltransferase [Streptomyces lasiicapitis]
MSGPARLPAIHFARTAPDMECGAGRQTLTALDPHDRPVGRLDFQICHTCRRGFIRNIAVAAHWQDQGVAREALHHALAQELCPHYAWTKTRQTADGRRFFTAMQEETDVAFPANATKCPHIHTP